MGKRQHRSLPRRFLPAALLVILLMRFGSSMQAASSVACSALSFTSTLPGSPIPVLGLGTWRSDKGNVKAAVEEALRVGYRHIDCAQIYQNQVEVGEGIAAALNKGYVTSLDQVWITSKIWNIDHKAEAVLPAAQRILRELKVPKLQHLIIHWPVAWVRKGDDEWFPKDDKDKYTMDDEAPLLDTWRAMEKLVDDGLVDTIGVSNFSEEEVKAVLEVARIKPISNQVECHPLLAPGRLARLPHLAQHDAGRLLSTRKRDPSSPGPLRDQVIIDMATKYKKTPAQVIIRWHLQKGNVVIPKSIHANRIAENADVFDFEITTEDMDALAKLGVEKRQRMINPAFRTNGVKVFKDEE